MKYILELEQLTKMSLESQNQKLRLFAKVDVLTKLEILQHQKQFFHKLKNNHSDSDNAVLTLSSLILAIDKVTKELDVVNLNAMKLQHNRIRTKRQKLFDLWAIIKTLKSEQNMSFRQISKYCQKFHKFEISHSMIQKTWNEIENTGEINVIK